MTPETFFENFALLADAPNSVQKLRELILQLAVRGKLIPQDPNDESASVLLEKIETEKQRLVSKEKIQPPKVLREVQENEVPYDLPGSWRWQRLEQVFYSISTSTNKIKSSEVVEKGKFPVVDQGQNFIAGYTNEANKLIELPGPVVVFGDHTCELKYIDFNFVAGADGVKILRPVGIIERYFYWVLRSINLEDRGYGRHYRSLLGHLFPLPPLAEQHRIVAKVDQLMALCDELEARQQKRHESRTRLNNAVIGKFLAAREPDEFAGYWQRICDHFDLLYDTPETIGQLRQAILQLAVQGKLVPQDPNDEPASILLEKIQAEKERLIEGGKIKSSKPLPSIKADEVPFALPKRWQWVRCGEIQIFTNGFAFKSSDYQIKGIGIVRIGDIKDGQVSPDEMKYVSKDFLSSLDKKLRVNPGDLLIAMSGATTGKLGFNKTSETFLLNQRVGKLDFLLVNPQYAYFYLATKVQENLQISSGSAIPNLSTIQINETVFPLPPEKEQHRIVTKVDQLMALCSDLEAKLKQSQADSEKLMGAMVQHLLAA